MHKMVCLPLRTLPFAESAGRAGHTSGWTGNIICINLALSGKLSRLEVCNIRLLQVLVCT